MQFDKNGFPIATGVEENNPRSPQADETSDAAVQAALATLAAQTAAPKPPPPGEIKWHLTTMVFPSILLLFVALYVTCLSAGTAPELALFQAGGASVILAMLGRAAVGILGDDARLVLNDNQIVAMARNGAVRDPLSGDGTEHGSVGTGQPTMAAQTAGAGGKE